MKKSFLRVTAVFLTIISVALIFHGCRKAAVPNEGINTVTDKNGITYLAVEDVGSDKIFAGVTDENGNLYAAEIDEDGNVHTEGTLIPVENYAGELPTNDTTAVSINESQNSSYNYANKDVVTSQNGTQPSSQPATQTTAATEPSTKTDSTTKKESTTAKKEEYLAEKYKKLFKSQTYYVEFTTDDEMTPDPITMACKNGNIYMRTKFEGMDCTMIYQKKQDNIYMVLSAYHVYCKMPSDMMDDLDMSDFGDATPVKDIEVSDVTLGNRDCRCETYTLKDGSVSSYYFYNGELVRLDQISTDGETSIMNIIKISSAVDDSLFELPKGFIPINLSKLNFDLGSDED